MSKEQKITTDIKVPNKDLEALRINFPHCFDKDGNFQLEKFKNNLTEKEINFSTESYGLDWLGKSYARLLASDPATTLLKADETHNSKPENINSENLLIKGDNLEVLKHLANAYYEQVKMIYIDPPYNTGSDGFVYEDDRKFTVRELQQLIGVDAEKAKRILDFTKQKSNSHSAWLTFMYPRLYIAKQLLKDDGVIFVSIDDSEVAQLRLLMDEVFGEENFVGEIIWQTATDNNPSQIGIEHEYIICFSKNISKQNEWEIESEKGTLIQYKYFSLKKEFDIDLDKIQLELRKWIRIQNGLLSGIAHYSYVDEKGVYYPGNSANTKPGGYQFEITHPKTNKSCKKPDNGWRWPEKTFLEAKENGDVWFGDDENSVPKIKKRLDTVLEKLKSNYYEDNRYSTGELKKIFDNKKLFDNPKSINLIKHLLKFIVSSNNLVLDFFAGSGTTADAIMQLNAEDSGNRKYILVQIPEPIDSKKNKIAYDFVKNGLKAEPTIFEITKERLIRSAKKINEQIDLRTKDLESKLTKLITELQTDETKLAIKNLQVQIAQNSKLKTQNNFKIFETTPIWEDYDFEAEQFDSTQILFDESKLTEDDTRALLTTWKTYDGIALTQELEKIDLSGYIAYYGNGKLYLMDKGFTTDHLKNLLEKIDSEKKFNPTSIIAFGYHLESKNLRELSENVKSYANKKNIDIDFITRY
jgi:adenine-specific DNA-methyltransferase